MIKYYGLPNIWSRRIMEGRYNSLKIEQMLWKTMKWWWTQARKSWRGIVTDMVQTRRSADPPWEEIGTVAMNVAVRLGGWSARRHIEEARKRSGVGVPEVPVIQFQEFSPETWPFQDTTWAALEGENWVQYKDRVFSPLAEQVVGVNTAFCDDYVAQRMPPIRDADELLRTRVRDLVVRSEAEAWADGRLRDELQQAGNWPLARVRNQIRTETATMYNAGRMRHFAGDDTIVGYEYVATIDNRTTPFCQAINGKKVRKGDLTDIPPFHFQCRTVTKPIFFWDKGYSFDDPTGIPSPGGPGYMQWEGFGQQELVDGLAEVAPLGAPRPVWKPTMTRAEADKWAADSAIEGEVYHGTNTEFANIISDEGFQPSPDGMFGRGIYLTDTAEDAESYAHYAAGASASKTKAKILQTRVRLKNPLHMEGFKAAEETGIDFAEFMGKTPKEAVGIIQDAGFDGLYIRQGSKRYVVAFEKEQVAVISG